MIRITQKCYVDNETKIAYCDVKLIDTISGYDYDVKFDVYTKKRFNKYLRKLGFVVGVVNEIPSDKVFEI